MSRVRAFIADVQVSDQFLRLGSIDVEAYAKARLDEELGEEARGPRGGRYALFGETQHYGKAQVGDDFIRNLWTFRARRMGKYVRPSRGNA